MPRLLLLLPATTYRAEAFLKAAERLNVDVTVGCEGGRLASQPCLPEGLPLDFKDTEACTAAARAFAQVQRIDAVLGVDDVTTEVAAVIAASLGLPHNPLAAVAAARNKYQMRERLSSHAVPVPRYTLCSSRQDPATLVSQVTFPCVVKPTILSASCGVIRADDTESFIAAYRRLVEILKSLGLESKGEQACQILVEEFVEGPEVALEGLLTNGTLQPLALFDKPDPLNGPFFEETIYVTPSRLSGHVQQSIFDCAADATRAIGLQEGPVHGEFRVNARGVWVIEVAARAIGGQCSRTLRFAAGMSLEELILRQLLRMDVPSPELAREAAGVMMLPIPYPGVLQEIRGQAEALAVPGIEELTVTAMPGDELVPLPEGTRYLGFLFARSDRAEAVEAALREAHRRLTVVIRVSPNTGTAPSDIEAGPRVISF
jgi:biotin carboxylase